MTSVESCLSCLFLPGPDTLSILLSNSLTTSAKVFQHGLNALLIDYPQSLVGHSEPYPALFTFDPKSSIMNIRLKSTLRSVVCVGNIVAGHCPLPRNLANSSH